MLPIGQIVGLFGLHGELKVDPTSAGAALFEPGARLLVRLKSGTERPMVLAQVRSHKGRLLVLWEGVLGASAAEHYVGATLLAERERLEQHLADDEILDADLIACQLYSPEGRHLGAIVDVEHYPASSMLVVSPGRRLVPFVKAFIRETNIPDRRIVMDLPPGLLEGSAEIAE